MAINVCLTNGAHFIGRNDDESSAETTWALTFICWRVLLTYLLTLMSSSTLRNAILFPKITKMTEAVVQWSACTFLPRRAWFESRWSQLTLFLQDDRNEGCPILFKTGALTEMTWAMVVAQSLPAPEMCGSNPDIGKLYLLSTAFKLNWNDEQKEKIGRERPNDLKTFTLQIVWKWW